jgi:hypothetical protein
MTTTTLDTVLSNTIKSNGSNGNGKARLRYTDEQRSDLQRAQEQEALARAQGIVLPPPVYALGTPASGGRLNVMRQEWQRLPLLAEISGEFAAQIGAERRTEKACDLRDLRVTPDGLLARKGSSAAGLQLDKRALCHLAEHLGDLAPDGAGGYWSTAPAEARAVEINRCLASWPAGVDRPLQLLVRQIGGSWGTYCIATPSYTPYYPDKVVADLSRAAEGIADLDGARCDLLYDGTRTRVQLINFTDISLDRGVAGEVFKAALEISTRDDRGGGLAVRLKLWRNLCLNFIIIGTGAAGIAKIRHTGDLSELRAALIAALAKGAPMLAAWLKVFSDARAVDLTVAPVDALSVLAAARDGMKTADALVAVPGVAPAAMLGRLQAAYDREPEPTIAGLANAVSRAAHESRLPTIWSSELLEEQAGHLLDDPDSLLSRIVATTKETLLTDLILADAALAAAA